MEMPDLKVLEEGAKAVQEVAKTTAGAIEASREFGGFVSRVVGGPIEVAMGILKDRLEYTRWERQIRLVTRAEELLKTVRLSQPTRFIPLSFAVPLLQAATLEEDDELQDRWAALLVNGLNSASGVDFKKSNIDILSSLDPFEAVLLSAIYSVEVNLHSGDSILTAQLPEQVIVLSPLSKATESLEEPSETLTLALANLARLGCVSLGTTWNGNQIFPEVFQTILGRTFVRACTVPAVA